MADLKIVIGNKRYSSWSLRGWLPVAATGLPFEETVIPLRQPDTKSRILEHSAAGRLPVLYHGPVRIWDSLAIGEYIAETFPQTRLWPEDPTARATARAIVAEMHSGFAALRQNLLMNVLREPSPTPRTAETDADIARITGMWRDLRGRASGQGPFLFGRFSLADVAYAPVCTRFVSYQVPLDPVCRDYVDAVMDLPVMRRWIDGARAEPWVLEGY